MSLWTLLGGEKNYKRINKWKEKEKEKIQEKLLTENNYQKKLLKRRYKLWKRSEHPIRKRIEVALEVWGIKYFKIFLKEYPNLVPDELNPFLNKKESKVDKVIDEKEELKKMIEYQAELIKKLEQQNSNKKE